jgi:hypothetical protein
LRELVKQQPNLKQLSNNFGLMTIIELEEEPAITDVHSYSLIRDKTEYLKPLAYQKFLLGVINNAGNAMV